MCTFDIDHTLYIKSQAFDSERFKSWMHNYSKAFLEQILQNLEQPFCFLDILPTVSLCFLCLILS